MKQSDIISTVLIGVIGFIVAYFVVNMFFNPDEETVTFKTIEPISDIVTTPDNLVFNTNAINPTVEVYIGDCSEYDINKDGILSDEEKVLCKQIDVKQ